MLECLDHIKAFQRLGGEANQSSGGVGNQALDLGCGGEVQAKHDDSHHEEDKSEGHELDELGGDGNSCGEQNDCVDVCQMGGVSQTFISLVDIGREGVKQFTNGLDQEETHRGVEDTVKHLAEEPV